MNSAAEIMAELKTLGTEQTKKTLMRHGAREPFYGVKVEDLKKIQKRVKRDYKLALDLFETGNSDAMYLAGLIADDGKMTRADLDRWADGAYWHMISECSVAWVAAGSPHGWEAALGWVESSKENIAAAGWATLSAIVSVKQDSELDTKTLESLLSRVQRSIHQQPNRVRYAMNGFLISVGCYVLPLKDKAIQVAKELGPIQVDMGQTACSVPFAPDYISKVEKRGSLGKKRKFAKC